MKKVCRKYGSSRVLLGIGVLSMLGACSSDVPVAPEVLPPQLASSAATNHGEVELLVLVDESGDIRRSLLVYRTGDVRRSKLERLGFKRFLPQTIGEPNVSPRAQKRVSESMRSGMRITYYRPRGVWNVALGASLDSALPTARQSAIHEIAEDMTIAEKIAVAESALITAEYNINLALGEACEPDAVQPGPRPADEVGKSSLEEEAGCDTERSKALRESSEFAMAAAAFLGSLEVCGVSLGWGCGLVVPAYILYQHEGAEMVAASTALLNCLRGPAALKHEPTT